MAGVTITDVTGIGINITLPNDEMIKSVEQTMDGSFVMPAEGTSANSVILNEDEGVQMLNTITDKSAPERYDYNLALPSGYSMQVAPEGNVLLIDGVGEIVLATTSAWAQDINGKAVPTYYEVNGNVLTQVIEHKSGDYAYAIVADPRWPSWVYKCGQGIGDFSQHIANASYPGQTGRGLGMMAKACISGIRHY